MKSNIYKIKYFHILLLLCTLISCAKKVTDFGFNGSISGRLVDESGKIVPGDITSSNLVIDDLGEGDIVPLYMRVKGDGTFSNDKLNPVKHKIYIEGPIFPIDTIFYDLTGGKSINQDIVVVPYLTISTPEILGSTTTSVNIKYTVKGNDGKVASERILYCSTVPYPSPSTGSGPYYATIVKKLDNDEGSVSVEGLSANTKYFLRIGAKITGAGFNYSEQIIFTTP